MYNILFAVRPCGPDPAHKPKSTRSCYLQYISLVCGTPVRAHKPHTNVNELLLFTILVLGLRCARAGETRPARYTKRQRLAVIDNICLRFAVRPCRPVPAHKPHNNSTINYYMQYLSSVCGAPVRAGPGPQATQQVVD